MAANTVNIGSQLTGLKTLDQAVSNSDVLVNDAELSIPIIPNAKIAISLMIFFSLSGTLGGYRFGLSGPASPVAMIYGVEIKNLVAAALVSAASLAGFGPMSNGVLATSGTHLLAVQGFIQNGANGGNVIFQFAQNLADASSLTVKRGSFMTLTPLN